MSSASYWEARFNTGTRLRLTSTAISDAFAEAWSSAPEDAQGVEIFGVTLCALGNRPVEPVIINHSGIVR